MNKIVSLVNSRNVKRVASVVAVLFIGACIYQTLHIFRNEPVSNNDVCIKYETITNGGMSTPIGKKQCVLSLEKVDTEAARELGLSGRSALPKDRGMLFVFDKIDQQCIWMKDMHFDLDIVWLNVRGEVIKLEEGVTPNTYPKEYCANNTYFVVEVNKGVAKSADLNVGSTIKL